MNVDEWEMHHSFQKKILQLQGGIKYFPGVLVACVAGGFKGLGQNFPWASPFL
jgi:hypothetical protein